MLETLEKSPAADAGTGAPLMVLKGVRQAFRTPSGGERVILEDVNLTLREGEIVGLLGRSGSGKSTMLRIVAGLARPTHGAVTFRDRPVTGPVDGVSIVFQTFALFPWLTVLENVEAGLEAKGMAPDERRKRALAAIDLIGLDGFESAYPRELSGGMRQRVGFARALVVDPAILLMDEPMSALDVLTAETLRTDFLDLWQDKRLPIRSVLIVTHNIEEAVQMCDRILLFSSNPGRPVAEIKVPFPHPRNRFDPEFRRLVDDLYIRMTAKPLSTLTGIAEPLPFVSTNTMAGLLELLALPEFDGRADLPVIASQLQLEVDDLFPITEVLQVLDLAAVAEGDVRLTDAGRAFADAEVDQRKRMFGEALERNVPLVGHILRVLKDRPGHTAPRARFEQELEDALSEADAATTLRAATHWGRYAELYAYDDHTELFSLENPQ